MTPFKWKFDPLSGTKKIIPGTKSGKFDPSSAVLNFPFFNFKPPPPLQEKKILW